MGWSGTTEAALVRSELLAAISMAVPTMLTTMIPIAIGRLTVTCVIAKFLVANRFLRRFVTCFTVKRVDRFEGMNPPREEVGTRPEAQTEYRASRPDRGG